MSDSITSLKRCPKCNVEKPLTTEFFYTNKNSYNGFGSRCKECAKQEAREHREKYPEQHKQQKKQWDERNADHIKKYSKEYYWNDPEKMRKKAQDWRKNNPELAKESDRKGHETRKEQERKYGYEYSRNPTTKTRNNARRRERYANDPEYRQRVNAAKKTPEAKERKNENRRKKYATDPLFRERVMVTGKVARQKRQQEKPEVVRLHGRMKTQRRRARQRSAEGSYTVEELQQQCQRQKGRCFYCGKKLGKTYHADHVIPLDKGGTNYISNIVCACPFCNDSKGAKLLHEWSGNGGRLL